MIISDLAAAFDRHFKLDSGTLVSVDLCDNGKMVEFGFVSTITGTKQFIGIKLSGQSYNEAGKDAAEGAMKWLAAHHERVKV